MKSRDGYISIYECGKKIFHSTYKRAFTATDYIKEVSMCFIENISKYKSYFEYLRNRIADFEESKRRAADFEESKSCAENIIINSVSIQSQEKKIGN